MLQQNRIVASPVRWLWKRRWSLKVSKMSDKNLVITGFHPHSYFVSFLHAVFKKRIGMGINIRLVITSSPFQVLPFEHHSFSHGKTSHRFLDFRQQWWLTPNADWIYNVIIKKNSAVSEIRGKRSKISVRKARTSCRCSNEWSHHLWCIHDLRSFLMCSCEQIIFRKSKKFPSTLISSDRLASKRNEVQSDLTTMGYDEQCPYNEQCSAVQCTMPRETGSPESVDSSSITVKGSLS